MSKQPYKRVLPSLSEVAAVLGVGALVVGFLWLVIRDLQKSKHDGGALVSLSGGVQGAGSPAQGVEGSIADDEMVGLVHQWYHQRNDQRRNDHAQKFPPLLSSRGGTQPITNLEVRNQSARRRKGRTDGSSNDQGDDHTR